jgi:hypothetical protein
VFVKVGRILDTLVSDRRCRLAIFSGEVEEFLAADLNMLFI